MKNPYQILPLNEPGDYKQGSLVRISPSEISVALGFNPNVDDDADKVVNSWGFTANGEKCGIWDYYGSQAVGQFSYFGPREVFVALFGEARVK